jgi:hypothetical protein
MTSDLLTNPQYWLDRAEEIRVLAERYIHPETKRMLDNIVTDYEHLARRPEYDYAEAHQTTALIRRVAGIRTRNRSAKVTPATHHLADALSAQEQRTRT